MALTGDKNIDIIILNNLNDQDLISYFRTNKEAYRICQNQSFWLNRILKKFPYLTLDEIQQNKTSNNWSDYYIYLSKIKKDKYHSKNIVEVKIAVEQGEDPNISLHDASYFERLDSIKYLIEKGADVNYKHNISLKHAVNNSDKEMIKYLIEKGANPYDGGRSPPAIEWWRTIGIKQYILNLMKY